MLNILIVDDERDVEMLYSQRFRKEIRAGLVKLDFAFGGSEALELLRGQAKKNILLVLSDINMPGMTGLELLRKIKDEFKGMKVMMVSAYGDDSNYNSAKMYGADDFVTKPVNFDVLKEKIEKITRSK